MNQKIKASLIFLIGLSFGALSIVLLSNYKFVKNDKVSPVKKAGREPLSTEKVGDNFNQFYDEIFNDEFFEKQDLPFESMKKMRAEMEKLFNEYLGSSESFKFFDNWYQHRFGGTIFDIVQEEDEDFIYYKIKIQDIDEKNVEVKIENNQVLISANKEVIDAIDENGTKKINTFKQRFERIFPTPKDVDVDKATILTQKDLITISFPKKKAESPED